ncbi:MAG: alpha-galactosidase [Clostridia bacterium]|nr:alpha-galactosidase [Clostridia bacterium]
MIAFKNSIFHLSTDNTSYLIGIFGGQLINLYYGKRLNSVPEISDILPIDYSRIFSPNDINIDGKKCSTDNLTMEYPTFGSADLRTPAFSATYTDGTAVTRFEYEDYEIHKGKYDIPGLPSVYAEDGDRVSSLCITMSDKVKGVEAKLNYAVFEEYDAITRSVEIINSSNSVMDIDKALSLSIDFRCADFDMITLNGAWARERLPERSPLSYGTKQVESMRGITSHHENPFFALVDKNTDEFVGEAYGFNLIYSGNFVAGAQRDAYNVTRAFMGINPQNFKWRLEGGEHFNTPEVVLVYSDCGIGKMSRTFHKLYRERLCSGKFRDIRRPVLINNWEATYFDFNEEKILEIARTAKSLGVELMVLDDGWFGTRNGESGSLGDWVPNTQKLPNGITGLAKKVRALDMSFGLWVEPEMVSPDSDLNRAHPDWCLHIEGREPTLGRNQLVLDLTRNEVVDYIKSVFDRLLSGGDISYVKWDMNRSMTEVGSAVGGPQAQGKVYHRYILGLYEIMNYVTEKYPDVLFEGCSGGGARFDGGILHYFPQIWTSDDTDALERLYIQYGTSICYPYSAMGAHVSAVPNHQVYRTTPMKMRGDVSICGQLGYELDLNKLDDQDKECVRKQIEDYKALSDVFHTGDLYRLMVPVGNNAAINEFISEDKNTVIVCSYIMKGIPNAPRDYVKLRALDKKAKYKDQNGKVYTGEQLMSFGIKVDYTADYRSNITVYNKVN